MRLEWLEFRTDGIEMTSQCIGDVLVVRVGHQLTDVELLGLFAVSESLSVLKKVPGSVVSQQHVPLRGHVHFFPLADKSHGYLL